jgi:hypothetical protein
MARSSELRRRCARSSARRPESRRRCAQSSARRPAVPWPGARSPWMHAQAPIRYPSSSGSSSSRQSAAPGPKLVTLHYAGSPQRTCVGGGAEGEGARAAAPGPKLQGLSAPLRRRRSRGRRSARRPPLRRWGRWGLGRERERKERRKSMTCGSHTRSLVWSVKYSG